MNNVNEKDLEKIVGGLRENNVISISMKLPPTSANSLIITAYVDGVLDNSKATTVDASMEFVKLSFSGTRGKKIISIRVDNIPYKEYELNFDDGSYNEI